MEGMSSANQLVKFLFPRVLTSCALIFCSIYGCSAQSGGVIPNFTVNQTRCVNGEYCKRAGAGFWWCDLDITRRFWDYCCRPGDSCGYSRGYQYPWCYVGDRSEAQWRPCMIPGVTGGGRDFGSRPGDFWPDPSYFSPVYVGETSYWPATNDQPQTNYGYPGYQSTGDATPFIPPQTSPPWLETSQTTIGTIPGDLSTTPQATNTSNASLTEAPITPPSPPPGSNNIAESTSAKPTDATSDTSTSSTNTSPTTSISSTTSEGTTTTTKSLPAGGSGNTNGSSLVNSPSNSNESLLPGGNNESTNDIVDKSTTPKSSFIEKGGSKKKVKGKSTSKSTTNQQH